MYEEKNLCCLDALYMAFCYVTNTTTGVRAFPEQMDQKNYKVSSYP